MAEAAIAVALLFDDRELVGQLREALLERGARIVHEGALSTLSRDMLHGTGTEVLVVNLDEEADDDLDRLYDVIEGDRPRVVFNDAQASRKLDGWDRARWARHLAVKVMAQGDLDPPRPQNAPAVPEIEEVAVHAAEPEPALEMPLSELAALPEDPVPFSRGEVHRAPAAFENVAVAAQSETLAAELEALLAADEPAPAADDFGAGLKFSTEDELPPLHDGHFGVDALVTQGPAPVEPPPLPPAQATARAMPSFQLDHLALAPLDESFMPSSTPSSSSESGKPSMLGGASAWSLVDEEEHEVVAPPRPDEFGIQKLSALDYLAPEGGREEDSIIRPGMSLELVSLEEAIAPIVEDSHHDNGRTMVLEGLDSAISHLLVLGAAVDGVTSACTFLSHLPNQLQSPVLYVQHLDGIPVEALAGQLALHSMLPVRVATHGQKVRAGEVLVAPDGQQVRVQRDGRVELQPLDDGQGVQSSPIDASFTMAANVFGRHAHAIVFAGHANDAVGGCQAIHDRGGQVWVESSSDGHFADMVHGIEAERLNSYSGTPAELAARLVEEMSMEGQR